MPATRGLPGPAEPIGSAGAFGTEQTCGPRFSPFSQISRETINAPTFKPGRLARPTNAQGSQSQTGGSIRRTRRWGAAGGRRSKRRKPAAKTTHTTPWGSRSTAMPGLQPLAIHGNRRGRKQPCPGARAVVGPLASPPAPGIVAPLPLQSLLQRLQPVRDTPPAHPMVEILPIQIVSGVKDRHDVRIVPRPVRNRLVDDDILDGKDARPDSPPPTLPAGCAQTPFAGSPPRPASGPPRQPPGAGCAPASSPAQPP